MKKLLSLILSVCVAIGAVFVLPMVSNVKTAEAVGRSIDVYFVAGQSNGAGYTHYNGGTHSSGVEFEGMSDELRKSEHTEGYDNIFYYGNGLRHTEYGGSFVTDVTTTVKVGYGAYSGFGAELGMAEYLSQYYNKNTGKQAIIIKYGVGSASLDGLVGCSWGNWCPPSKVASGEATIAGSDSEYSDLYANFFEVINNAYDDLQLRGYTDLNFKGMYWAQGEAESGNSTRANRYGEFLEAFINDFRADLYELDSKQNNGKFNYSILDMPFAISEINHAFNSGYPNGVDLNGYVARPYVSTVASQEAAVCAKMSNVHLLDTDDYIISKEVDALGNRINPGCYDNAHYSADDMLAIGKTAGEMLYNAEISNIILSLTGDRTGNTTISKTENQDGSVTANWYLGNYHRASKIILNGQDVTSSVTGNSINFTVEQVEETCSLIVEIEKYKSKLEIANIPNQINVTYEGATSNNVYENGSTLRFKLAWNDSVDHDGYMLRCVSFNGQNLVCDDNGYYSVTISDDSTLNVAVTTLSAQADKNSPLNDLSKTGNGEDSEYKPATAKKEGCSSSIAGESLTLMLLAFVAIGALIVYKRRKTV